MTLTVNNYVVATLAEAYQGCLSVTRAWMAANCASHTPPYPEDASWLAGVLNDPAQNQQGLWAGYNPGGTTGVCNKFWIYGTLYGNKVAPLWALEGTLQGASYLQTPTGTYGTDGAGFYTWYAGQMIPAVRQFFTTCCQTTQQAAMAAQYLPAPYTKGHYAAGTIVSNDGTLMVISQGISTALVAAGTSLTNWPIAVIGAATYLVSQAPNAVTAYEQTTQAGAQTQMASDLDRMLTKLDTIATYLSDLAHQEADISLNHGGAVYSVRGKTRTGGV